MLGLEKTEYYPKGIKTQNYCKKIGIIKNNMMKNWQLYLLFLLPLTYYVVFRYYPMYGALIAFKKYDAHKGIIGSEWVGLKYFKMFLEDPYFYKVLRNTLLLSFYTIIFGFPAPILFSLLLNEVIHEKYKKLVQTVTYIPHFISIVVVCGMLSEFLSRQGFFNIIRGMLGLKAINFLQFPQYFRTIYVTSNIWQNMGWNAIIYLAALSNLDPQLYQAAEIEGINRLQKAWYITLPGLVPTITIMLIMRIGNIMNVGYEKVLLLYSSTTYEVADIIGTYVYRRGLLEASFSYATAIGLFQSLIAVVLLTFANSLSKKLGETSLW